MQQTINEFIEEQRKGLTELLSSVSKSRVETARTAARQSAQRIKALNDRVRQLAKSGVRLNAVSHGAAQDLIHLHEEIVTSALGDAAARLQKMAYTESVRDLARMQADVLQSARQRIVADLSRAVTILKDAAGDARKAMAEREKPGKTAARRKAATKRKTPARARTKAKATRKVKTRAKAKAKTRTKAKARAKAKAKARTRGKRAARRTGRR